MSIRSLRKELFWTRILLGAMFIAVFFCDLAMHEDYEHFKNTSNHINDDMVSIIQNVPLRSQIMPSCFIGRSTK